VNNKTNEDGNALEDNDDDRMKRIGTYVVLYIMYIRYVYTLRMYMMYIRYVCT